MIRLILILTILRTAALYAQEPLGDDFQLNSHTTATQEKPDVAVLADGRLAVFWRSADSPGDDPDSAIVGRLFSNQGVALGNDFQANMSIEGLQSDPRVAALPDGGFAVTWRTAIISPFDENTFARVFDSLGAPVTDDFRVNELDLGNEYQSDIAATDAGGFVVVWQRELAGGDETTEILARRFTAAGSPIGGEFQVNSVTEGAQLIPRIAKAPDGRLFVVWYSDSSLGTDQGSRSIQGRWLDESGTPMGVDLQLNAFTPDEQRLPDVAFAPDGSFLVVWESWASPGDDNSGLSIQARFFDPGGASLGDEFQVNVFTLGAQYVPSAAQNPGSDEFLVDWTSVGSFGNDDDGHSIQGRLLRRGAPTSDEFQVNSQTAGFQARSEAVFLDAERFFLTWDSQSSSGSDQDELSIQGRIFGGLMIFADSFESGDASAWSQIVP